MEKKSIFGLGLLILALLVIGGSIFYLYTQREDDIVNDDAIEDSIGEDAQEDETATEETSVHENLNLEYDYLGDNVWRYMVTGTLPNPCYEITTEVSSLEGDEDIKIIRAIVTPPDEDMVCAQVIQEVYEEEEFEGSEEVDVWFEIH
jgi:hypothetical protein